MKKDIKNYTEKDTKGYTNLFDNPFNGSARNYLMRNNGFAVGFNMPEALSGDGNFRLPPYAKRMSYLVDKYPACPKDWLRSEGIVKSFFVPVMEGKGMWLDFNENENHTHHVAIVVSVQGVNPITGMPCKDAHLEQYIEECPKHKIKFGPDRYCSKCDYKWPKQNYITTTATPRGQFWLDGFRSVEGIVRQYILTAEKMRGVASNVIGKDRVYAIGLSFFVSKEKKPQANNDRELRAGSIYGSSIAFYSPVHTPINWVSPAGLNTSIDDSLSNTEACTSDIYYSTTISSSVFDNKSETCDGKTPSKGASKWNTIKHKKGSNVLRSMSSAVKSVQTTKMEIGAGAKINQSVYDDPEKLDFWHDKPESIICVNYCTEEEAHKIIEEGEVNIEGHAEGFLQNVPVGN